LCPRRAGLAAVISLLEDTPAIAPLVQSRLSELRVLDPSPTDNGGDGWTRR